jgi:hypothetical protein
MRKIFFLRVKTVTEPRTKYETKKFTLFNYFFSGCTLIGKVHKYDFVSKNKLAQILSHNQGCQMVSFQTKNPNLGKFWWALDWKMLIYINSMANRNIFTDICDILWPIMYYILCSYWYILPVWVSCTRKIWQPCTLLIWKTFLINRRFSTVISNTVPRIFLPLVVAWLVLGLLNTPTPTPHLYTRTREPNPKPNLVLNSLFM